MIKKFFGQAFTIKYVAFYLIIFCSDLAVAHFYTFDPNLSARGLKLVQNTDSSTGNVGNVSNTSTSTTSTTSQSTTNSSDQNPSITNQNQTSANQNQTPTDFNALYTTWTQAFNNKDINNTCALFAPDIVADYRGYYPRKRYGNICEDFKKIFGDKDRTYSYRFKILEVYESNNFAAVRVTWFLKIDESTTKRVYEMQEEGLDILQKINGEWKIVNYLAYPTA